MGIALTFGVGSLILALHPLPVDFKIEGASALPAVTQTPVPLSSPPAPLNRAPLPRPVRDVAPAVAVGFGRDVPLEFAVRQLAPHWLYVRYGDDVDRQAHVSWQGGRPWNVVLGGVLTPLDLHMTMSGRTLWIRD
jgi:hypothetical protein